MRLCGMTKIDLVEIWLIPYLQTIDFFFLNYNMTMCPFFRDAWATSSTWWMKCCHWRLNWPLQLIHSCSLSNGCLQSAHAFHRGSAYWFFLLIKFMTQDLDHGLCSPRWVGHRLGRVSLSAWLFYVTENWHVLSLVGKFDFLITSASKGKKKLSLLLWSRQQYCETDLFLSKQIQRRTAEVWFSSNF